MERQGREERKGGKEGERHWVESIWGWGVGQGKGPGPGHRKGEDGLQRRPDAGKSRLGITPRSGSVKGSAQEGRWAWRKLSPCLVTRPSQY